MHRDELLSWVPEVLRPSEGDRALLLAVIDAMVSLAGPVESALDRHETFWNPRRCPDSFVPFLARWVDVERLFEGESTVAREGEATSRAARAIDLGRLRELVAQQARISQWRGTRRGLVQILETATGCRPFEIEESTQGEDGRPLPFHIAIRVPADAREEHELIRRIVESEKPAHVTYALDFSG